MAAANWLYLYQLGCQVEVGVEAGRLFVATGAQDAGMGSRSVLAGTVAAAFGVEPAEVDVRIGRSRLVRGPASGGSSATATFVPTTLAAIADLKRQLIAHAGAGEDGREPDWAEVLASAPDLAVRADRPDDARPAPAWGGRWRARGSPVG